jgi:hypothetical protein
MSKLTAVEWLFNKLWDTNHITQYTTQGVDSFELLEQAKAMDRERLIDFARYCETEWNASEIPIDVIDAYLESN